MSADTQAARRLAEAEAGPLGTALGPRRPGPTGVRTSAHNVTAWLEDLARQSGWMDRRAYLDDGRPWSYEELHAAIASSATLLAERGARPERPVLVATHDRIAFVLAFLGAARLGAVPVPVNPRLTAHDYAFMTADARPTLVVCEDELVPHFPGLSVLTASELEARGPRQPATPAAALPENALLYGQYTSGTTGTPKLVLHRHSDVAHHAEVIRTILEPTPDDVFFSVSRAYFSYGLGNSVLCVLSTGVGAVLQRALPTVAAVSEVMARARPTVLFAVPTFYAVLVTEGEASPFRSLRACLSAGEALAPAIQEHAADFLGATILNGLGSTEVGHLFVANTLRDCTPGTFGRAMPGYTLGVRDERRELVEPGEMGTLWVQGPTLMVGYHNRPEESERILSGDWLCTGDRVIVDGDGLVHHHGRSDDLEMVGGISVAPMEIEAVLAGHPAVEDVAVVALPDGIGASRLRAFAVLAPGQAPSEDLERSLLQLVRDHLVAYMVPRSVTFVAALPRTPSGKLQRHVLRRGWPQPGSPSPAGADGQP